MIVDAAHCIDGIHQVLGLHELAVEDTTRPKLEIYRELLTTVF